MTAAKIKLPTQWFLWVLTLPAELSSAGIIIAYWLPNIGSWVWALIFLVVLVGACILKGLHCFDVC